MLSGSEDGTISVWDAESGAELAVLCRHESGVIASRTARTDGGSQAAHGTERSACGKSKAVPKSPSCVAMSGVNSIAYSPDGRRIASSSVDGTVRVWDTESGAEVISSRDS